VIEDLLYLEIYCSLKYMYGKLLYVWMVSAMDFKHGPVYYLRSRLIVISCVRCTVPSWRTVQSSILSSEHWWFQTSDYKGL